MSSAPGSAWGLACAHAPNLPHTYTLPAARRAAVGLSAFGLFLLWQAVNERRTVVYVTNRGESGFTIRGDGHVRNFAPTDLSREAAEELHDPTSLLLFDGEGDGRRPPIPNATAVLLTSPVRDRYKIYEELGAKTLIFPVFSRPEMHDLLESCFPLLHTEAGRAGVWERFQLWGGIPRYVLSLLDEAAQMKAPTAIGWSGLDKLDDALRLNDLHNDFGTAHNFLHLTPRGKTADGFEGAGDASAYQLARLELGTPRMAQAVHETLATDRWSRLRGLLAWQADSPGVQKFR